MSNRPVLRRFIILAILFMTTYALAEGIRYRSIAGIIMAIISMLALLLVVALSRKLAKLKEAEEEEESIR